MMGPTGADMVTVVRGIVDGYEHRCDYVVVQSGEWMVEYREGRTRENDETPLRPWVI